MNIVFDFGAVLFNWRPVDIVAEVFPQHAVDTSQAKRLAQEVFGHEDWQNFDRGLLDLDAVTERTSKRLGLDANTLHHLFSTIPEWLLPLPDSLSILQLLLTRREAGSGVSGVYFLSNMPAPYARDLESKHTFLGHFDGGIFSADVHCSKPDLRIYQLLQSRYGFPAESTVFIDDMPGNVEAARELGWKGIHFTSASQLATDLVHHCGL
ncbi:HAD family phosphatase [Rhodoferax sp. GW822-FHT02A01]|uniref:HAD family hydrolase n=1 Tax=Rhodoferax sp. GW822-FHT02A01 TaxID=3141537 RepID=UPI00315CF36B